MVDIRLLDEDDEGVLVLPAAGFTGVKRPFVVNDPSPAVGANKLSCVNRSLDGGCSDFVLSDLALLLLRLSESLLFVERNR
jgi:hypothetical protein